MPLTKDVGTLTLNEHSAANDSTICPLDSNPGHGHHAINPSPQMLSSHTKSFFLVLAACVRASGAEVEILDSTTMVLMIFGNQHYGASDLDPNADDDGDGLSNLVESRAGTDPFDPLSSFELRALELPDGAVHLRWDSEAGKDYIVEHSANVIDWTSTGVRLGGTGNVTSTTLRLAPVVGPSILQTTWDVPVPYLYDGIQDVFDSGYLNTIPIRQGFTDSLRIPQTDPNENGFFVMTRAILTVPATGDYQFYITAGDESELWLSSDEDPANAEIVASVPRPVPINVFVWEDSQISQPISLIAGQRFYLETRLFEYNDTDHLQVAWTGPGIALEDIPPSALGPYENLPSSERAFFRIRVLDGDADRDGLSDWSELKHGYSTQTATSYGGVNDRISIMTEATSDEAPVHVAYVVPEESLDNATGSGIATLRLSATDSIGNVSLQFNHLTANAYTTAVFLTPPGGGPARLVRDTPDSEFIDDAWDYGPDRQAVLEGLNAGRLFFRVLTPSGQWTGTFSPVGFGGNFVPPPAPPALSIVPPTRLEAIRFLNQATFGADEASIDRVQTLGYESWIDEQLTLPASLHRPYTELSEDFRSDAWWKNAITAPDQLRMRMAFALSEVIPVNRSASNSNNLAPEHFYDHYVRNAFGNYRQLLEDVTLSPMMGQWLTYRSNARANPVIGRRPDENYAREIMQLFTIGLVKLHPDGTVKIGRDGIAQPTYNQRTVEHMARVFTGWTWFDHDGEPDFFNDDEDMINSMSSYPSYHDAEEKVIVNGIVLPPGQSPEKDLADTLDVLTYHDNIAPFISHLLIQRFITSNPSRGYLYRVASAWENNGHGERGDLGTVIKAILLDYEARDTEVRKLPGYGKLKEPIIRWTQLFRAFGIVPQPSIDPPPVAPRFAFAQFTERLGQGPMDSPTVFNFFEPDFTPSPIPGQPDLHDTGLKSPEFQIMTETVAVSSLNAVLDTVMNGGFRAYERPRAIALTYQTDPSHPIWALAEPGRSADLVEHLNEILLAGTLLPETRDIILAAIDDPVHQQSTEERLNSALYLILASSEHAVQR